ncbi:hypothetical protein BJ508DRAFT_312306 [Ascobolus immersus RN42]|uniref:Uncharacterized protein n=1 Tax=Ascobolus immersus RN42 TaxID=1160509 RepID=A0A3N4HRG6_ASCIM|nr:hypothetical protein BJ508DRAFT_312306 [Ascobolus immersus RN42]
MRSERIEVLLLRHLSNEFEDINFELVMRLDEINKKALMVKEVVKRRYYPRDYTSGPTDSDWDGLMRAEIALMMVRAFLADMEDGRNASWYRNFIAGPDQVSV